MIKHIEVIERQIEELATQIITEKQTLLVYKKDLLEFEFNRDDVIEETLSEDFTMEYIRGGLDYRVDVRKYYELSLIEHLMGRVKGWLNDGYTMEVK